MIVIRILSSPTYASNMEYLALQKICAKCFTGIFYMHKYSLSFKLINIKPLVLHMILHKHIFFNDLMYHICK